MHEACELQRAALGDTSKELPVIDAASLTSWLFERARTSLSDEQLEHVGSGAADLAERAARNAAQVAEGVGCYVDCAPDVGAFSSEDSVSELALHFGATFRQISGLLAVANGARNELTLRKYLQTRQ
jgi:hypothetical protein